MVAPSFQSMEFQSEPYMVNNKAYITVKNPKTGTIRQVRWYTEKEYQKAYGSIKENYQPSDGINYKKILGFDKGYITIFKNDPDVNHEWFRQSTARYCTYWGWYFVSTDELPNDIPDGFEPIRLNWSDVSADGVHPNSKAEIRKYIETLIYPLSQSEFVGSLGERLTLALTLNKDYKFENGYGVGHIYEFEDDLGNIFIWTTNARVLTLNNKYELKGTVKDFKLYKGVKQTHLTRCIIQKGEI